MRTQKKAALVLIPVLLVVGLAVYLVKSTFFAGPLLKKAERGVVDDVSRLNATKVARVVAPENLESIQQALSLAREEGLSVSIAGMRHSMGGHTLSPGGLLLDMTSFNEVIAIDEEAKTVRVESGATWNDVIRAVNPYGLSVPVLQDYSTFTVGGSLSVNIHQSDPNYGSIMETVRSFRLFTPSGEVLEVSRTQRPELFDLVIGGYGLFGIVLDVDLDLTDNHLYQKHEEALDYAEYEEYFTTLRSDTAIENVFARLSIVPDETLLKEMVVTTYAVAGEGAVKTELEEDRVWLKKLFFDLSRSSEAGKRLRWYVQKNHSVGAEPLTVTRNNLDYNDASFLEYHSNEDTDILQEYFFPKEALVPFLDSLREVVVRENINLLSATVRYIPPRSEGFITYASPTEERFGVVLYLNVGRSPEAQEKVTAWTRELIDTSTELGGTYYLPYELYATKAQLKAAYPRIDEFFAKKTAYDPEEILMNKFYRRYAKGENE
ncbi:MAG: FAD-binding oxidoreductase [Patescibacteria group bacterium]